VGRIEANGAGGLSCEKPRLGRYPKIKGSQAPQMKNCNTIISHSLIKVVFDEVEPVGFIVGTRLAGGRLGGVAAALEGRGGERLAFPALFLRSFRSLASRNGTETNLA
jgi:hypothetical protein